MNINIKIPEECSTLTDVRAEIDRIDRSIVNLMSERFEYVKEVVKYRVSGSKSEYDHTRYLNMLDERAQWANEAGLNGEAIKNVFKLMVDYFIEEQKLIANK